ncbi:PTPS-domain-containing protein [Rozella allomycis CSF55]|uniref:6-pyruvoyl tetrahydrobiopterin synthase n=1 Tax=Rozella allomycis (strain CSF55) TaxID=988480 RepID=A0A4V1IZS2_ROZAC|nr:PTPS-domain-containing protein [Rozella allomycis CSF55]
MPIVYLTRKEHFSSAHRLESKYLTEIQNREVYSKCFGIHGHNYTLKVTLRGTIVKETGMVINITDMKRIIQEHVLKQLDHKNLGDLDYFQNEPSTAENIAIFIWNELKPHFGDLLYEVKLKETENNTAIYRGE